MPQKNPTVLTMKDLERICYESVPSSLAHSGMISSLRPDFTARLGGMTFKCVFDGGAVREYRFSDRGDSLSWREKEDAWHEERCECLESSATDVFLVHYLRTHTLPYEAETLVIDRNTSLVTCVTDRLGTIHSNRDVKRTVASGYMGGNDPGARHAPTDEMVGLAIDWRFSKDAAIHSLYETVQCCAFVSPPPPDAPDWQGFFHTFNPAKYIKVAEKLFLITFYAPGTSGMEVSMLMDLLRMRAVGAVFGIDLSDALRSYTFGAKGAYACAGFIGRYTV